MILQHVCLLGNILADILERFVITFSEEGFYSSLLENKCKGSLRIRSRLDSTQWANREFSCQFDILDIQYAWLKCENLLECTSEMFIVNSWWIYGYILARQLSIFCDVMRNKTTGNNGKHLLDCNTYLPACTIVSWIICNRVTSWST